MALMKIKFWLIRKQHQFLLITVASLLAWFVIYNRSSFSVSFLLICLCGPIGGQIGITDIGL